MPERGLAHLEEFLDTIVALPHDAQRLLTQLREQEALTQQRHKTLHDAVRTVLSYRDKKKAPLRTDLEAVQELLISVIAAADEKVSLAQHLHQTVKHHVKHLEDEICCFEEEVRLARTYGELDEEPEPVEEKKRPKRRSREEPPRLAESPADFDKVPAAKRTRPAPVVEGGEAAVGAKSPGPRKEAFSAQEPTYCYCNQVSFGEMIGCDNPDCDIEWFHYSCVGLSAPPPGKWFCPDCTAREAKNTI
ncbi:Inhibitor of growth protein, partial [Paramicrosporidium saccamoebae]